MYFKNVSFLFFLLNTISKNVTKIKMIKMAYLIKIEVDFRKFQIDSNAHQIRIRYNATHLASQGEYTDYFTSPLGALLFNLNVFVKTVYFTVK